MDLQPARKRQKRSAEATQKEKRIDFVISSFSKELALKVFSYLSSADLVQCAAVSSHWAKLANDETVRKVDEIQFGKLLNIFLVALETFILPSFL